MVASHSNLFCYNNMCNEPMQETHLGIQLKGLCKFWRVSILLFGDPLLSTIMLGNSTSVSVSISISSFSRVLSIRPPSRGKVLLVSGKMPICGKVCLPEGKLVALVSGKVSPFSGWVFAARGKVVSLISWVCASHGKARSILY